MDARSKKRLVEIDCSDSNLRQSPLYVKRKVTHHESDVWRRCVSSPLEKDLGHSTGLNSTEVRVLSINFPAQHVTLLEYCDDGPPNLAIMKEQLTGRTTERLGRATSVPNLVAS